MTVTPMMAQYLEIKAAHPDALLFYRMGDFYEMFFDDAVAASEALDIALTKRGKHDGKDIAMCGVPHHAAEGYLLTLIRKGFRVGVCEQLESPAEAKKRGYKSIVKRDVVRLVTPGTLTEDSLLNARSHNYLAAFVEVRDQAAIAWVDISTGTFSAMKANQTRLAPELARLSPSELIVPQALEGDLRELVSEFGISLTGLSGSSFDSTSGGKRLCDLFGVKTLEAYGTFDRAEIAAMGAIVDYLNITQKGKLPLLQPPQQEQHNKTVQIDAATRRNLEPSIVWWSCGIAFICDRLHSNSRRCTSFRAQTFRAFACVRNGFRTIRRCCPHVRKFTRHRRCTKPTAPSSRFGPRSVTSFAGSGWSA